MTEIMDVLKVHFARANAWSPLWITLKTGIVATIIAFFLGLLVAQWVMKRDDKAKALIDSILTLPMVLPPTVMGFVLLLLFSKNRLVGAFLNRHFGLVLPGTWIACVIAAIVIAFPLMYRNARAAFEQVDITLIYAARTLGMSELVIFWKIIIPNAMPGILAGTILAFARAIGEYGATSMFAGNILGRTSTVSQQIAVQMSNDNWEVAGFWTLLIVLISGVVVLVMNLLSQRGMKSVKRWE